MHEFFKRESAHPQSVQPQSVEQFVSLQIADALQDRAHASEYIQEGRRTSAASLIAAYRVLRVAEPPNGASAFCAATRQLNSGSTFGLDASVIGVRISRRRIACAVLSGLAVEYAQIRELPSNSIKADLAASRFLCKLIERYPKCAVAIEGRASGTSRPDTLQALLIELLHSMAIPLHVLPTRALYSAFQEPACRDRSQFRSVVATIWPALTLGTTNRIILDAAGIALFFQVHRFLGREELEGGAG